MKRYFLLFGIIFIINAFITGCCNNSICTSSNENKLWIAMDNNNFELAKEAIEQGANINLFSKKTHYERTSHNVKVYNPILVALVKGEYQIAEYLINCGANVNFTDSNGESLVQYCAEDYPRLLEKVINAGADLEYKDHNGYTVLDYAINYSVNNTGETAFDILLRYGVTPTTDTAKKLIENMGFEKLNMLRKTLLIDNKGIDKCLIAAFTGNDNEVLKYMHETNHPYLVMYGVAAFCTSDTLYHIINLIGEDKINELLQISLMYDNKDVVKYILKYYDNLKSPNSRWDILYYAAKNDDIELIDIICKSKIPYDISQGLLSAIENKNNRVLRYFIEHDADPNATCLLGCLLTTACFYNNEEAVEILIKSGSNVNGQYNGDPLVSAINNGNSAIVKLLIENGANVNGTNTYPDGSSEAPVLISAIQRGQYECVKLLVENGADLLYIYNGKNALEKARETGSENIYNYLKESM